MFSRFTRIPIRRCLHTIPPRPTSSRLRFTLCASAIVTATYLTWRLNTDGQRIALDSATKHPPVKQSAVSPSAAVPPPSSTNLSPETSFDADPINEKPEAESTFDSKVVETDKSNTNKSDTDAEGGESPDAGTGGAFNPVTGEINWDCPCLGGMAHGPCGPEFREAFSCFVFSEEEPKGINCVEKFKGMQNCFREHPEIYGDEIMEDDDDESAAEPNGTPQKEQDDVVSEDLSPSHSVNTETQKPRLKENPSPVSATS